MAKRKSSNSKSKWKRKPKQTEALIPEPHQVEEGEQVDGKGNTEEDDNNGRKRFFACYLLTSLSPRSKNFTYIGFTVNPRRRIRQHNGEIKCGAFRTKGKRPLAMVFCIYGFPTQVSALQFEWAWQHPRESKAVREAALSFKSFSGVANKIKLAYTMLGLPPWQRLNLTVDYFSTKYKNCSPSLPSLPLHIKVRVCPMDELPCYTGTFDNGLLDDGGDGGEYDFDDDNVCENVSHLSRIAEENVVEREEDGKEQSSFQGKERLGNGEDDEESDDRSDMSGNGVKSTRDDAVAHLLPVDCAGSIDIGHKENWGWCNEEPDWRHTGCSHDPELDIHMQSFNFDGTPGRRIAPVLGEMADGNVLVVIDDGSDSKLGSLKRKDSTSRAVAGEDAAPAIRNCGNKLEVIDLLSPSPECTMWPICKRSRFSGAVSPKIIDLT
ncbi:unnamed protein product [Linum tenue]|uniref:Structure-specific endonuclease subunit SLX1 homolog n=1 Tax=Linum tenue TaxID=586396 RepID=A0AAV0IPG0_9ROSI|nr:unnamed protein product [Linum tenue]